ncbi:MAG: bifunctional oligoribonuclease/PAP phosphatase NrnA [Oligoflexia bacterium]|nr:bifunctional oligoribonuclease/PAP phosphatase NrnA [Oligoflexia bacterium]
MKAGLAEIAKALLGAQRVVVLSHINPDPDAHGSSSALALALKSLGKTVALVNESGLSQRFAWIPGVKDLVTSVPSGNWDVMVCCDCGDAKRVGDKIKDVVLAHPLVINIDHHASNDNFGRHNLVVATASSTCEVILELLDVLGVTLSKDIATCIYTGISSDTGSFRYSSTSAGVFAAAKRVVEAGADPFSVAQNLYARNSLAALKLQSEALGQLKLELQGRVAVTKVTYGMLKTSGADKEDADVMVDVIRDIEGVQVALLLKEDSGFWRVSLRSRVAQVDVAEVAAEFGGGGHKAAAGLRWRKGVEDLMPQLLAEIEKRLALVR